MGKRDRGGLSRYEEIAVDLARKIANRELREGERILGRSSLAGTYKVSPETIRRAIAILHDRGVVRAIPGSGIRVVSRQLAQEFLESLSAHSALSEIQEELEQVLAERRRLDERIGELTERLVKLATRTVLATRRIDEVTVPPGSWVDGQTLQSARLRNLTGATVIAVVRGDEEYYSPGPDFRVQAGDLLMVVGPDVARERVQRLLESPEPPAGS